jgi:hypothetical protein
VRRWRTHFQAAGLGDPYIVMAQSHGETDPRPYGMDAAAGFPPHNHGFRGTNLRDAVERLDSAYCGTVFDYAEMAAAARAYLPSEFPFFPGVCPGWDNEARHPGVGICFKGANPDAYGEWLAAACQAALASPDPEERIVFVNAWNEWAEGAHLEPDRHFGYAYLVETARVVSDLSGCSNQGQSRPMPSRSASPHGKLREISKSAVKHVAFRGAKLAEWTAVILRRIARL